MKSDHTELSDTSQGQLPAFSGFPYLLTRITADLFHLNLLPLDENYTFDRLLGIARRQVRANKLRVCLVLRKDMSLYFEPDGEETPSAKIPTGG